jgi:hypothetical protein
MKRYALAAAALLCCAPYLGIAQKSKADEPVRGFYGRLAFGYALPQAGMTQINGQAIDGSATLDGNNFSVSQNRISFGQGLCLRLACGYQFSRRFAAELGVHGVFPQEFSYTAPDPSFGNYLMHDLKTKAQGPIYIVPAFVVSTGRVWRVYGRAGIGLPVVNKVTMNETQTNSTTQSVTETTRDLTLNFKPSFEGSLGLSHPLNAHLSIEGELCLISRNAYAKHSELTKYTLNGQDGLPAFSTNQKETDYSFSYDNSLQQSATEPAKAATFAVPFSSFGFNIGVRWNFRP